MAPSCKGGAARLLRRQWQQSVDDMHLRHRRDHQGQPLPPGLPAGFRVACSHAIGPASGRNPRGCRGHPRSGGFWSRSRRASAQGLGCRSPFCTSGMLMCADDGPIDHDPLTVRLSSKCFEDALPNATSVPAVEASEDGVPRAEAFRQIPPRRACSVFPENRFNDRSIRLTRPPHPALLTRQQWLQLCPHSIRQEGSRHALPQCNVYEVPQLANLYNP